MTDTNIQTRQPSKMDYASPVQFRFKIAKLPQVEFFIQTVNLPGISIGEATVPGKTSSEGAIDSKDPHRG